MWNHQFGFSAWMVAVNNEILRIENLTIYWSKFIRLVLGNRFANPNPHQTWVFGEQQTQDDFFKASPMTHPLKTIFRRTSFLNWFFHVLFSNNLNSSSSWPKIQLEKHDSENKQSAPICMAAVIRKRAPKAQRIFLFGGQLRYGNDWLLVNR